jgi:mannose-6-phosphate isomerase-like protein (cupin superfamily)
MSAFKILTVPDFTDPRGSLFVLDGLLPFEIRRVFYIVDGTQRRGGHRHHETRQAMICLKGSVDVYMNNGEVSETVRLDNPRQCLLIEPRDWHHMENFSKDSILLVFASAPFDLKDYITEPYK